MDQLGTESSKSPTWWGADLSVVVILSARTWDWVSDHGAGTGRSHVVEIPSFV